MKAFERSLTAILALLLLPIIHGLKLDVKAHLGHESAGKERCIRNFVARDTLVVVTATVDGTKGDGQVLNMHVRCNFFSHHDGPRMAPRERSFSRGAPLADS